MSMQKQAIVVGAGRMGMAARYAFEKLGYTVNMVDPNIAGENIHPTIDKALDDMFDADVVLSCAPYFANLDIAQFCAKAELNYCDLGGDPNTGFAIQKAFHNHKLTEELATDFNGTPFRPYKAKCLTDLGLAPGLVNILGYHYAAQLRPKNLVMAVGGLPQNPNLNTMKYNTTWSPDGLYNEYMGDCYVLKDGKMATEPALEGYERIGGGVYEDWLEMFNTKGGVGSVLKHLADLGVENAAYKTLRYEGHHALLHLLLHEGKMSKDDFCRFIQNACPATTKDVVYIKLFLDEVRMNWKIKSDDTLTAMQKATAFSAVACASIVADGVDSESCVLTYANIPCEEMLARMNRIELGIL